MTEATDLIKYKMECKDLVRHINVINSFEHLYCVFLFINSIFIISFLALTALVETVKYWGLGKSLPVKWPE